MRAETGVVRWWAALVLLSCLGLLGLAAWLKPDPRGYGTHEQFGSGPCGMIIVTGYPCPTCGMTTAFAHTVRGQWYRAFMAQPAGFVAALGTIAAAVVAVWALATGRWPAHRHDAHHALSPLSGLTGATAGWLGFQAGRRSAQPHIAGRIGLNPARSDGVEAILALRAWWLLQGDSWTCYWTIRPALQRAA